MPDEMKFYEMDANGNMEATTAEMLVLSVIDRRTVPLVLRERYDSSMDAAMHVQHVSIRMGRAILSSVLHEGEVKEYVTDDEAMLWGEELSREMMLLASELHPISSERDAQYVAGQVSQLLENVTDLMVKMIELPDEFVDSLGIDSPQQLEHGIVTVMGQDWFDRQMQTSPKGTRATRSPLRRRSHRRRR